ncbi:MAG: 8-amino-7-oxononanoate synthase [Deltaproteobacteria bacterium]|nr:8-amino-7-oxononanoate synthase [Deltaproteobacteria bacterium]
MRDIDGPQAELLLINGRLVINFSSNNYLGLASHPLLHSEAHRHLTLEGLGSGASRLIAGNLRSHRQLEEDLARFFRTESALLFNSGYHANIGVLSSIATNDDQIFSDALNHASIVDGCRLSRARVHVFPHGDLAALKRALSSSLPARRRIIVTDSIFSMDGDTAALPDLRTLAQAHDAVLMVDEAHATGVTGPGGRGLAAALGIPVDIHVGTLSKGVGAFGAFVAGSRPLIEYLLNRARSFVFTTALPPSVAAAARAALSLLDSPQGEVLRARLHQRISQFRSGLATLGLLAPGAGETAIFPIVVGDSRRTMEACEALLARGIFAQGIRPPTVPHGTARLRFSLMATHAEQHLERALAVLEDLVAKEIIPRSQP